MTRPFLFCLILGLSFFSLIHRAKSNSNAPKAFESGLVTTEYVDSKVLFVRNFARVLENSVDHLF